MYNCITIYAVLLSVFLSSESSVLTRHCWEWNPLFTVLHVWLEEFSTDRLCPSSLPTQVNTLPLPLLPPQWNFLPTDSPLSPGSFATSLLSDLDFMIHYFNYSLANTPNSLGSCTFVFLFSLFFKLLEHIQTIKLTILSSFKCAI